MPIGAGLVVGHERLGDRVWAVFGGGGLKGLAHVGAWRALEEAGAPIAGVIGTSIGALVAACLAGGLSDGELSAIMLRLGQKDVLRLNRRVAWLNGVRAESVFRGDTLRDYIESILPVKEWDELAFPLQINALNLATGETEWFGIGARTDVSLVDAIYASTALPVLFPPARLGDAYFVDGGVEDMLPLSRAVELGATGIIAVDPGSGPLADADEVVGKGLVGIHERVFVIMSGRRRREMVRDWDECPMLFVRPKFDGMSGFDFSRLGFFVEEGYRATTQALAAPAPAPTPSTESCSPHQESNT